MRIPPEDHHHELRYWLGGPAVALQPASEHENLRDTWSPWVVPGEIRVATTYSRSGHELRDTWSPWVVPGEKRVATAYSRAKENAILGRALGCTRGSTGGHLVPLGCTRRDTSGSGEIEELWYDHTDAEEKNQGGE